MGGFEFVDDEVIGEREGAEGNFSKLWMFAADHIDACFEFVFFGFLEGESSAGLLSVEGIERVEEREITKVENAGFCFGEVEMLDVEEAIRSALVKEGASSSAEDRHGVGVGS